MQIITPIITPKILSKNFVKNLYILINNFFFYYYFQISVIYVNHLFKVIGIYKSKKSRIFLDKYVEKGQLLAIFEGIYIEILII